MPAPTAGGSENEGGGDNGSSSDIPEVADLGAFHPDQLETLADIQEELERLEAGGNVEMGDVVSMDDDVVDHEVTIIAEQEGEGMSILPDMEDQETILTEEVLTLPDSAFNVDDGLGVSEQIVSETMEIPPSDDMESVQVSTVETYVPISSVQSAVNSVASLVPVSSAESLIIEEPVPTIIEQTMLTESIQMQPHTAQIQTSVPNVKQLKPIVAASKKSIITGGSTKNVIAKVLFTNTQGHSGQPVLLGTEGGQTIRILNACNVSNNKIISSSPKTITLAQAKQMGLLTPGKLQQILPTNQKNVLMNKVMVDPKKTVTVVKSPAHSRKTVTVVKSPAKILPLPTTSQLQSIAPLPSVSGATTPQKVLIRQGSTLKSGILTSGTPGQIIRIPNSQNISSGSIHQIQMPGKPVQYVQFVATGSNSVTSTTGPITIVSSDSSKLTQGKFVPVNAVPVSATTKKPIPVALTTNLTSIPQQFKVVPIAPAQTIPQQTSAHTRVLVNAALPSDAGAVPSVVQAASLNNIVMVPAQYVQQLKTTESSAAVQTASTDSFMTTSSKLKEPVSGDQSPPRSTKPVPLEQPNGIRPRKPCNCTKSQCLKLYCDCFANGEFCYQCNCNSCFNNLDHEEDRQRAIKSCLERNPNAFRPKIGKSYVGDGERRHNKGCNCKRSGCLKNYCECYEAKIPCSNNCKCVGCRNVENDLKELAQVAEERVLQANTVKNKFSAEIQDIAFRPHNSSTIQAPRQPFNLMTQEVIQATCQCLLAQVEIQESLPTESRQRLILEEFGRCLVQIINCATKTPMSGPT